MRKHRKKITGTTFSESKIHSINEAGYFRSDDVWQGICEISDHRSRMLRLGHVGQYVWILVSFILQDFQTAFTIVWLEMRTSSNDSQTTAEPHCISFRIEELCRTVPHIYTTTSTLQNPCDAPAVFRSVESPGQLFHFHIYSLRPCCRMTLEGGKIRDFGGKVAENASRGKSAQAVRIREREKDDGFKRQVDRVASGNRGSSSQVMRWSPPT